MDNFKIVQDEIKRFAESNEEVKGFFVKSAKFLNIKHFNEITDLMKRNPKFINKMFTDTAKWDDEKFQVVVFFLLILIFAVHSQHKDGLDKELTKDFVGDTLKKFGLVTSEFVVNDNVNDIVLFIFNEYDFLAFDKEGKMDVASEGKIRSYEEKNGLSSGILLKICKGLYGIGVINLEENLFN